MDNLILKTESAYSYPLLIKNMLLSPAFYNPEQEIVYRGIKRYTYAEFRDRVCRLASALLKIGVKRGDTVAVMDFDTNRYLECYFAVPMIGAVLHTINIKLSSEQLIYTIDHAEDSVILINSELLPILEHIKGKLDFVKKYILMTDDDIKPDNAIKFTAEYESMLKEAEPLKEFPDFDENTRATTFYTTGTTGHPKGVYFSHRQLVLHTLGTIATLCTLPSGSCFHREDVYMPLTPMFHVHAWGIPYIAVMLGVKQVYPGKYVPDVILKLVGDEKVTFSHCVPTILHMLLRSPACANANLSKWKVIIGGAALPKALCLEAMKKGIDVFSGYGMSETCPVVALAQLTKEESALSIEKQVELRTRTGRPTAFVQMKIKDENNSDVPANDSTGGELLLRTPFLTQGYFKDNRNSEKLWENGWLHTNDVACVNSKGSIRITDRLKDIIKVGGEWISSLEIEDIILSHPAVSEVALIGQQSQKWGEIPFALVVTKPDNTLSEKILLHHVKGYVDKGILSKEVFLLKVKFVDAIDKTSVGKINKVALREKHTTRL
jgi:fatty-acyl-CoA synthase